MALLAPLMLAGCAGQNTSSSGSANVAERRVVALAMDNLRYYLDADSNIVKAGSSDDLYLSLKGVLGFALYDGVVVKGDLVFYDPATSPDESDYSHYRFDLPLNAAGDGSFVWEGNVFPASHPAGTASFFDYTRKTEIEGISGNVIYTI
jgi:hypothetical protein